MALPRISRAAIARISRTAVAEISRELASTSKEAARALPDSKGGEVPKQLQTYRTEIYSYFTQATGVTELLYSAENWVRIKLSLETAGPVAIGTVASLEPVLSGRGILLDTDQAFETYLPKGTRVYIISETVNRVSVTIEPVPWLEQIAIEQSSSASGIRNAIGQAVQTLANAIAGLRLAGTSSIGGEPTTSDGKTLDMLPCPPAPAVTRARLLPSIRRR